MKTTHLIGIAINLALVLGLCFAYASSTQAHEPGAPRKAQACMASYGDDKYRAVDFTIHDGYYRLTLERNAGVVLLPMANTVIFER